MWMIALVSMFAFAGTAMAQDYASILSVSPAEGQIKLDDNENGLTSITIYMDGEWDRNVYAGEGNPVPEGVSLVGPEGAVTINDSYGFCMWEGTNQINVNHTPYTLTTPGEYTLTIPAGLNTIGGKPNPAISYTWTVVARTTFEFSRYGGVEAIGVAGSDYWSPMRSLEGFKLPIPEDVELVDVPASVALNVSVNGADATAVTCALAQTEGSLVFTFPAAYTEKCSVNVEIPAGVFTCTTGLTNKAFNTSFSVDPTHYFSFEIAGEKEITGPITGFDLTLSEEVAVATVGQTFTATYWQDGNQEKTVNVTGYSQNGNVFTINFADEEFPHDVYVGVAFAEGFLATADGAISHSLNSWNHFVKTPTGGGEGGEEGNEDEGVVFDFGAGCSIDGVAVAVGSAWPQGAAMTKDGVSITSNKNLEIKEWGGTVYFELPRYVEFDITAPEGATIEKVTLENSFSNLDFEGFAKDEKDAYSCTYENAESVHLVSLSSTFITKIIVKLAKDAGAAADANFDFIVIDQTHHIYTDNGVSCEFGAHWVGYGCDLWDGEAVTFISEEKKIAKVELDITSKDGDFIIREGEGSISVDGNLATWMGATNKLVLASTYDIAFSAARIWFASEEEGGEEGGEDVDDENETIYANWKELVLVTMKEVYDANPEWPTEDVVGQKPADVTYAVCKYYYDNSWLFGPMGFGDDWKVAVAYYEGFGKTLAEQYEEGLAVWNAYDAAELVAAPTEVTLVEEGVATGVFYDYNDARIDCDAVPVAYEKWSDGSFVLKNFWATGYDLTAKTTKYWDDYNCYSIEFEASEELGTAQQDQYGQNWLVFNSSVEYNTESAYGLIAEGCYYYIDDEMLDICYYSNGQQYYAYFTIYLGIPYQNDGIHTVLAEESDSIYDLAGRRIAKTQKGLNIINGKVVLK